MGDRVRHGEGLQLIPSNISQGCELVPRSHGWAMQNSVDYCHGLRLLIWAVNTGVIGGQWDNGEVCLQIHRGMEVRKSVAQLGGKGHRSPFCSHSPMVLLLCYILEAMCL